MDRTENEREIRQTVRRYRDKADADQWVPKQLEIQETIAESGQRKNRDEVEVVYVPDDAEGRCFHVQVVTPNYMWVADEDVDRMQAQAVVALVTTSTGMMNAARGTAHHHDPQVRQLSVGMDVWAQNLRITLTSLLHYFEWTEETAQAVSEVVNIAMLSAWERHNPETDDGVDFDLVPLTDMVIDIVRLHREPHFVGERPNNGTVGETS